MINTGFQNYPRGNIYGITFVEENFRFRLFIHFDIELMTNSAKLSYILPLL